MEKKKVKIVFIDIDGVFNHLSYYKSHRFCDGRTYPLSEFDPDCVKRYMRIIEKTGAKTVISSSWRFTDGLRNIMEQVGFYGSALEFETTPYLGTIRGLEIRSYLEQYEDTHKNEEVESYCIIDDETDMLYEQKDNFVNTDINFGLTDEDTDKVIKILLNI